MKDDKIYKNLVAKMEEISSLFPQKIGFLTPHYKRLVPFLKYNPWIVFTFFAIAISLLFYFLFGSSIVKFVSLFQYGF
ncbi:MAG: hypothetical protein UU76_C0032G0009 [Parcubacteria group bacterium GW2011_GWC1_41_7]|nr:MAG: hypothetical protein UU76_C0032G0009 [Parcubacteria group bacterium GW2011_GWC1_41_7]